MLHKTRGIVLKVTDYSESSVVVKIFTEKFGVQSYLINGVKKPKAKVKMNMLQALHLLDMVVYHKPMATMHKVSDVRSSPILSSIPYDISKSAIAMFLNEVIYKSIKEQVDDALLFEFISTSIELLDQEDGSVANFHLVFLMKLTRFLGFHPDLSFADTSSYFDLKEGAFVSSEPPHAFFIKEFFLEKFIEIIRTPIQDYKNVKLDNLTRKYLLDSLIDYFSLHVDNFGVIKSQDVLEDVLG
ncbi:DNA repair protein RecO [Pseudopedobacter saltans DSM 12145]|uniref:DNA repair protein RecO n=1 Tax=Pseudopedobacter saltans (strain ATCC 51119 / DSM 12145 / JCM 21818 / CCUG 39354 / LMG 10337 / NBRC 100064 / NCIMB 13643) TaxID=762903 RepID=F0S4R0_PSESL|nr:DNA repair protein RecO [Pseudopedobacter saltans]ADY53078.1 DNA repair protein RecO [Pseudopedobacter saltans DSM 12145]